MSFCWRFNLFLYRIKCSSFLELCFICSLLLSSCNPVPTELKLAERLLQIKPDSALYILRHLPPHCCQAESSRALYGLLLFQALDKTERPLQPDSLIEFSIGYYEKSNDDIRLANAYFLKARKLKLAQKFEEATPYYLKAMEISKENNRFDLLGQIFADMGNICLFQVDNKESLNKLQQSLYYYKLAGDSVGAAQSFLEIGRAYRIMRKYQTAHKYYLQGISQVEDSINLGFAYQEIGINYYWQQKFDSADHYLRKSLRFPYQGTNYSIRLFQLADLSFDVKEYDSAYSYASKALLYPASFFTKRECYRILANTEYLQGNFKQMAKLMSCFQDCSDSVRKFESQTKSTVIEDVHQSSKTVDSVKENTLSIVLVLILILFAAIVVAYKLYLWVQLRKAQLADYQHELTSKQEYLNQNISHKIIEMREMQAESRKLASSEERLSLDRELYEKCLHLSNWTAFSSEMNHAFNNIVEKLTKTNPAITQKEISWCCMHLLDVPAHDRMLLLDASADSLYKLKQRLAKKLNLKSTKDLDSYLNEIIRL